MKEYYTYAYLREDGTPYYIGKGTGNRAYAKHRRKNGNFVPVPEKNKIIILKWFSDEELAYKHEEYMISHYGKEMDGGILINLCEGGKTRAIYNEEERKNRRKTSAKEYYERNKELCLDRGKKWIENNREKRRSSERKRYNAKNPNNLKVRKFITPSGDLVVVKNLKKYCETYGLIYSSMLNLSNGYCKTCKGYKRAL